MPHLEKAEKDRTTRPDNPTCVDRPCVAYRTEAGLISAAPVRGYTAPAPLLCLNLTGYI